jgi:hypothetical protein
VADGIPSTEMHCDPYPQQDAVNKLTQYTLHGHTLEEVSSAKYLGITIHNKLKWNVHISNIKTKATKTLGFI